jgi:hypothetical protein
MKEDYIVHPKENYRGMSYGDWAEAWSNWFFSSYPDISEAQGPMVFLRGNLEYHTVDRNNVDRIEGNTAFYDRTGDRGIVIPEGKAIFIPVMIAIHFIGSEYEGQVSRYEQQIRYVVQKENDKSGGIYAMFKSLETNWKPIVNDLMQYRATSSMFKLIISENNPFIEKVTLEEKIVPGEYQAVIDGFFIILKSLPKGTSWRLRFGGKGRQKGYRTDAVYDIHITPSERSEVTVRDVTSTLIQGLGEVKEEATIEEKDLLPITPILSRLTNIDAQIDPLQGLP